MAQPLFWSWVSVFLLLTWIGARPVEEPYIVLGQILTCLYFSYFLFTPVIINVNDKII
jgi:ubiquinol-cytochrome c reductase cytochrome b subunit